MCFLGRGAGDKVGEGAVKECSGSSSAGGSMLSILLTSPCRVVCSKTPTPDRVVPSSGSSFVVAMSVTRYVRCSSTPVLL